MYFSEYGKLDICWDGRGSLKWRRSIFPAYKMNREKTKAEPSYQLLMSIIPMVREILSMYPCRQIEVERVEADDIIFSLAGKYTKLGEDVLVITSDKDLAQLYNFFGTEHLVIYNPIKKLQMEVDEHIIEKKSIIGDRSDNIGGLFRIGPKTFDKMLADEDFWNKKMTEKNNKEVFSLLHKIIDLSCFPYSEDILDAEENLEYNTFEPDQIEMFLWEHKLKDLLDRWPKASGVITNKLRESNG